MNTFFLEIQHFSLIFLDPARIPLAMAAILLTAIAGLGAGMLAGPLAGNANPFFWLAVGQTLGRFGGRLDRVQRMAGDLVFRGFLLTVLGVVLFSVLGGEGAQIAQRFRFGGVTEIALLALALTSGAVWAALLRLYRALKSKKTGRNAYYTIAATTRTDLSGSDDYTITRVGMGMAARAFDKGIVAPVFWYILAGLPGAYIYAGIAALSWRFGKDGFTKGFGRVPLLLERVMGILPHLFSGFLMALAGLLTPTGGMTRAFAGLFRKKGRAPYDEGGLPVTAMASALLVALGGPASDLDGSVIKRSWAGPEGATAQLEAGHLRRALYISVMAHLLLLAGMGTGLLLLP